MSTCLKCGGCCKTYIIDIIYSDIIRWENEGRKDILQEISFINNYPTKGYGGFYIEKTLRNPKQPCPFLINNLCSIFETRPLACVISPQSLKESICPLHKYDKWTSEKLINKQQKQLDKTLKSFNRLMAILVKARN